MMGLFIRKTAYCFLIILLVYSCGGISENKEIKTAIARYNNAITEVYKNQNFELLKKTATENEVEKISAIINAYLQANEIMESEIIGINYIEIKEGGEKAAVRTSEEWKYRWVNYKTGKEVETWKHARYDMLYHIIKKDGGWLVDRVESLAAKISLDKR